VEKGSVKTEVKSIRIIPAEIETDPKDKSGKKILMQRQWQADKFGRFFLANVSAEEIRKILGKTQVKVENLFLKDEGDSVVYKYKGRPMIKLNKKDGLVYSPTSEIEAHGKEAVQHQAHIVLNMLKKYGFSNATMGKPVCSSSARNLLGNLKTYK
jgi:hypothetical protein